MKGSLGGVVALGLVAVALAGLSWDTGCAPNAGRAAWSAEGAEGAAGQRSTALPPLVIDKAAPLLLDELPPAADVPAAPSDGPMADNSACYVCHENLRDEEMVDVHARAPDRIGCVKCHGDSFAHRNDENNTTPPDVMYPSARVDRSCKECHETHDAPALDVLARFRQRFPQEPDREIVLCTDCHGSHRLKVRTVQWNKRTGQLIATGQ